VDGGINGDRNKGGDIEKRVKVAIRSVNSLPHCGWEEEQFRQGKGPYGTIKDRTITAPLCKGPNLLRRTDQKKIVGRSKKIGKATLEVNPNAA
jgi:hypothetical protein